MVATDGNPVEEARPILRRRFVPTAELLRALAALPSGGRDEMRAEMDALFGEDRGAE